MAAVKAVLVSVWLPAVSEADHLASLAEMRRLAHTLGIEVVRTLTQRRRGVGAAAVVGAGKLAELARLTGGTGTIPSGATRRPNKAQQRAQQGADATEPGTSAPIATDDEADAEAVGTGARDAAAGAVDGDSDDRAAAVDATAGAVATAHVDAAAGAAATVHVDAAAGADATVHVDAAEGTAAAMADVAAAADADADVDAPPVADLILVDNDISPTQVRNLERATDAEVLDRSAVIIEIFHRHARTREARLQVELARLAYEAPRVRERPKRGDRQRAGSVGGSGESDLELDRRRIRDRMAVVRRELEAVASERGARREHRRDHNKVALVGYTNAGKSSLMRALTGSEVLVADQLFATLGTTVRVLAGVPPPRVLLSDTVGFIKNLPHDLVASFRSTLDEAHDASLLLFVVDAADPACRTQLQVTRAVLADIGLADAPQRIVLNKCDMLEPAGRRALELEFPGAAQISTRSAADVAALLAWLRAYFERGWVEATLRIPYDRQALVREAHLTTRVLRESYEGDGAHLQVRGDARAVQRLTAAL